MLKSVSIGLSNIEVMCAMYDKIVYKFSYITQKNQIIMIFVLINFILLLKSIYV